MMQIKVKKLWHGNVSIRDYLLQKAIKDNQGLLIQYDGQFMELTPWEFINGKVSKFVLQSKHDKRIYRLVDFPWKPNQNQLSLLE